MGRQHDRPHLPPESARCGNFQSSMWRDFPSDGFCLPNYTFQECVPWKCQALPPHLLALHRNSCKAHWTSWHPWSSVHETRDQPDSLWYPFHLRPLENSGPGSALPGWESRHSVFPLLLRLPRLKLPWFPLFQFSHPEQLPLQQGDTEKKHQCFRLQEPEPFLQLPIYFCNGPWNLR